MNIRLTPTAIMTIAATAGIALVCAAMLLAVRQPWLGLNLTPQPDCGFAWIGSVDPAGPAADIVVPAALLALTGSSGNRIELLPDDLIEDPDRLVTYWVPGGWLSPRSRLTGCHERRVMTSRLSLLSPRTTPVWMPMTTQHGDHW